MYVIVNAKSPLVTALLCNHPKLQHRVVVSVLGKDFSYSP